MEYIRGLFELLHFLVTALILNDDAQHDVIQFKEPLCCGLAPHINQP